MIISASDFKTQIDLKRDIVIAADNEDNPNLVRASLFEMLHSIEDALTSALCDNCNAPTEVLVAIGSETWNTPGAAAMASFFTGLGYTFSWSNGIATVSWG